MRQEKGGNSIVGRGNSMGKGQEMGENTTYSWTPDTPSQTYQVWLLSFSFPCFSIWFPAGERVVDATSSFFLPPSCHSLASIIPVSLKCSWTMMM